MSAPTPTLYKPAHVNRAREYCVRTNPDLGSRFGAAANGDPAGAHPLGDRAKRAAERAERAETSIP